VSCSDGLRPPESSSFGGSTAVIDRRYSASRPCDLSFLSKPAAKVAELPVGFYPAPDRWGIFAALMLSLQVLYEGNVQGVGFRWSVRHIATGFDVTGWVRNLRDGRVELQVGGDESEVLAFLDAIKTSELASHIRRQQEARLASQPDARGFEIRQ
jgi:acylphosphatase